MTALALFDFDGTITTRETFVDFVRHATPPVRLALGRLLLLPVYAGYKAGLLPASWVRACVVAFAFTHVPQTRLDQAVARYDALLGGLLRPEAMERIRWHQSQGHTVVVVSGNFEAALAPWCARHGLGLIASVLDARNGRLTGRYRGAQCVRAEKVRRIREAHDVSAFAQIYAYGDTHEDHDLLAMAHRRFYRWQEVT